MISVEHVSCGYKQVPVVEDISFTIHDNEFVCILGANGSGKTTLLKSMLGLIPLMQGRVLIDDVALHSLNEKQRAQKLAYIPQAHKPPFPFSVADVVLMGRTPHIISFNQASTYDKECAMSAMEKMHITALAQKPYTQLSGGQQQLVLIARALAQQPRLFIMDEPTSALDFGNEQKVLTIMKTLTQAGTSVLMVTHNPHHALYCADTVLVLHNKHLLCSGNPQHVLSAACLETIYQIPFELHTCTLANGTQRNVCFSSNL